MLDSHNLLIVDSRKQSQNPKELLYYDRLTREYTDKGDRVESVIGYHYVYSLQSHDSAI